MTQKTQTENKVHHYAYIDALRGWAFLGVLLIHCQQIVYNDHQNALATFASHGAMGVQLFFLISALTLVFSYRSRIGREKNVLSNFFIRRVFRIAPLYWLACLCFPLIHGIGPSEFAPSGVGPIQILSNLTFLHAWYPTTINSVVPGGWSIGVEMMFYLLMPLLYMRITTLPRAVGAVVVSVIASVVINAIVLKLFGRYWSGDRRFVFDFFRASWLPVQMPVFLLGFVLSFLIDRDRSLEASASVDQRQRRSLLLLLIGGYLLFAFTFAQDNKFLTEQLLFGLSFLFIAWGLSLSSPSA